MAVLSGANSSEVKKGFFIGLGVGGAIIVVGIFSGLFRKLYCRVCRSASVAVNASVEDRASANRGRRRLPKPLTARALLRSKVGSNTGMPSSASKPQRLRGCCS